MSSGRVMEVLGRMALGITRLGGLVVELGESVALVAPLPRAEGVGEPFAGGHADDQAAVEAVGPGAEVPRGAAGGSGRGRRSAEWVHPGQRSRAGRRREPQWRQMPGARSGGGARG